MNSILSSTLYNNYNNYSSPIPDNFDWKLYAAIVKDPTINSSSSAYNHYKHKCTVNSHNYRLYWRTYYKIPNNFVEESYKKYLNFSSIKFQFNNFEDLYKFYITKGIEMYPLNDQYSRIHFEIPHDFDAKIYITVYPEAKKENDNQIYHFYHYNKESFPLNAYYYRLKYDIPDDFDISVYNERYNFNYNESNAYQFFKNIGKVSYPLDSKYYSIKYNIPDDFDIQIYNKRYNFNYNESNAYQFFKNIGQYSFPLDDIYYRLLYKIPNEFDLDLYKKKYKLDLSPNEIYIFYATNIDCRQLEPDSINEICEIDLDKNIINENNLYNLNQSDIYQKNDNLHMDINIDNHNNNNSSNIKTILKISCDFNYETYNLRYQLELNEIDTYKFYKKNGNTSHPLDDIYYTLLYKTPSKLTNKYLESFKILYPNKIKINHTMKDVLKYYSNTVNNSIKDNPIKSNDMEKYNHIFELIDPNLIYKDEVFFYDFINLNIKLKNIYEVYLKYPNSDIAIQFINNFEYLNNFKEYFSNEESKRNYFLIRDFANEYFNEPNLLIETKSYFSIRKTITKTKMVTKKRKVKMCKEKQDVELKPLTDLSIPIYNQNSLLSLIELIKQNEDIYEYEDYEEEEKYTEEIDFFPIIYTPLYTTFYYNLNIKNSKFTYFDIYLNLQNCQNFYNILKKKNYIVDAFSNFTPNPSDNKYSAFVILNDNYIHNYLSILNNLMYLSKISHFYIYFNPNLENSPIFNYYYKLISNKIETTKIHLPNEFTFNHYNNLILDISFWESFKTDYIILFNTLTFLKNDLFSNDISKFNSYYISNNLHKTNNLTTNSFSIRSKSIIIDLLKNYINKNILFDNNTIINNNLNIDKPIENYLFHKYFNNNININYLEIIENNFHYLDFDNKLIEIISKMR